MVKDVQTGLFEITVPWWFSIAVLLVAAAMVFGTIWLMKRRRKGKKPS